MGEGRGQAALVWYDSHCSKSRSPGIVGRNGAVMPLWAAKEGQSHLEVFCYLRYEALPFPKSGSHAGSWDSAAMLQKVWSSVMLITLLRLDLREVSTGLRPSMAPPCCAAMEGVYVCLCT